MEIKKDFFPYLTGECFSNPLTFPLGKAELGITDRIDVLKEIARGKNVIHVGRADHYDAIEQKHKEGRWLHACLCNVAAQCIGIDVNQKAIALIQDKIGIKNVFCIDIVKDELPREISEAKWNIVVLGEMLEHLVSPFHFLVELRKKFGGCSDKLVVTVPNAFSLQNFRMVLKDAEIINSDHRFAFSPYTISKILVEAGFSPSHFYFCNYAPPGPSFYRYLPRPRKFIENRLLKKHPALRDSLVVSATFEIK